MNSAINPTASQLRPFTASTSRRYAARRWSIVAGAPEEIRCESQRPPASSRRNVLSSIMIGGNLAIFELGRAPDAYAAGASFAPRDLLFRSSIWSVCSPNNGSIRSPPVHTSHSFRVQNWLLHRTGIPRTVLAKQAGKVCFGTHRRWQAQTCRGRPTAVRRQHCRDQNRGFEVDSDILIQLLRLRGMPSYNSQGNA